MRTEQNRINYFRDKFLPWIQVFNAKKILVFYWNQHENSFYVLYCKQHKLIKNSFYVPTKEKIEILNSFIDKK